MRAFVIASCVGSIITALHLESPCTRDGIMPRPGESYTHRIVLPEAKLAFCFQFKIASEAIVSLFNDANQRACDGNRGFMLSQPGRLGVNWSTVTRANGWKFGIFIRDPVERYLSAFLNKCDPLQGTDAEHCAGPTWPKGSTEEQLIQVFEMHVLRQGPYNMPLEPAGGQHFLPQTDLIRQDCGFEEFSIGRAEFVANSSDHHFGNDVRAMLERAGVKNGDVLADRYFPTAEHLGAVQSSENPFNNHIKKQERRADATSFVQSLQEYERSHMALPSKAVKQFFRRQAVIDKVLDYYADDCRQLGGGGFRYCSFTA